LGLTSSDVIPALNSFSFDISIFEIFLPLLGGARMELISRETATDGLLLSRKINQSSATIMDATPATWKMLLAADWKSQNKFKILCGGEELTRDLANLLLERSNLLWNAYGPTETTVFSNFYQVFTQYGSVPIGRPIANTRIYILDKTYNPVPIGVPGELNIGGTGLARGYLNRPELTAEKFIPNPFSEEPGERLYRTGDLARYLPDGNIEFLGRIDNQVKIRGFRIETGEIESALMEHSSVRDTVVVARDDENGDPSTSLRTGKRLVAYVVSQRDHEANVSELRDFLTSKLPDYMIPSSFVMLDEFPLTPSGKVDRKALPKPDKARPELGEEFVAPRTPTEQKLADIWAQVLGVERIGIYDDFFDLGGHSLLATQVVSRVRDAFNVELPIKRLIAEPTIAGIAESID
jgi:acyl-CoA synthetase (AMP-forming)/AMP-acid ligase II/acyl carrier protein